MTDAPDIKVEMVPLGGLLARPGNARRHSEDQIAAIGRSILEFGFTNPILADDHYVIIAGHGRHAAATRLGLAEVPVIVARGWTDDQIRAYVIADNRLAERSSWDETALADEMAALLDSLVDPTITGFSSAEINKILDPGGAVVVQEINTGFVADRFWISIRGPLARQADVLDVIKPAIEAMGDVEIDVGAVALGL
jgi:hypothetical protein